MSVFPLFLLNQKHHSHTGLDTKDIVGSACYFWILANVAFGVYDISIVKFIHHSPSKTVKGAAIDKGAVGDKGYNPVAVQSVHRPSVKTRIHIVGLGLLRGAVFDIGLFYPFIYLRVFAVLVVFVLVHLVGVVGRVADDDGDLFFVLAFDAVGVFVGEGKDVHLRVFAEVHVVVQGVHEAEVFEFEVLSGFLFVGEFDVEVGDVVGQDLHFVGVEFVAVFVFQFVFADMVDEVANEGAGAGGGIEDLHAGVFQHLAKVFLQEVIRTLDHEAHDFVGRVDHAEAIGFFGVVTFVKVFIDDLEEALFFVVVVDAGSLGVDGVVIMFDAGQGAAPDFFGEEGVGQLLQFVGDVVFLVEVGFVEDGVEDIGGEDMLDDHFADVLGSDGGIDHVAAELEKGVAGFQIGGIGFRFFDDDITQGGGDEGDVGFE